MTPDDSTVNFYGTQYGNFGRRLYAEIRAETFGEDIGQNSWLTTDEQDLFLSWLAVSRESKLLDVACGSGGPALRMARLTNCVLHGIDLHAQGITEARNAAVQKGLSERATFEEVDASQSLPFPDSSFHAITCIDAINHLPNRQRIFHEWHRILFADGSLLFTDPVVVTGPLTNREIAIRSSIGFFLFVPPETNERMLRLAGFEVVQIVDRTENMARIAARWYAARTSRAADLKKIEGESTFEGQQQFLEVASRLASEGRLSRFAFHARRK